MEGTVGYAPRRRWLSDLAALHNVFAECHTVQAAARMAVRNAAGRPGSWGKVVEDEFVRLLAKPSVARRLSAEAAGRATAITIVDLPEVVGLDLEPVPGERSPCDLILHWRHPRSATSVPANVKTVTGTNRSTARFLCALAPLVAHLTDPEADIRSIRRGLDPDAVLVELLAGRLKLVPGRDYLALTIDSGGDAVSVWAVGAVSRLQQDGISPMVVRHSNRDVVNIVGTPGPVLGSAVDIARTLASALLPRPRVSRIHTQLLAAAPPASRRALAAKLADMSTEDLAVAVSAAFDAA